VQHQVEGRERAGLLRLRKKAVEGVQRVAHGFRWERETRRRVTYPRRRVFLSAATRHEGRYRCGQLKPFRLLLTEAAIACPHQVGQTTWTRQLITSSFRVDFGLIAGGLSDPRSASQPPLWRLRAAQASARPTPRYRSVVARSREGTRHPAPITCHVPTRYGRTQALRYDHWKSHALTRTATVIQRTPHARVGMPVRSASMAASDCSSGRSSTSLLMSRMA